MVKGRIRTEESGSLGPNGATSAAPKFAATGGADNTRRPSKASMLGRKRNYRALRGWDVLPPLRSLDPSRDRRVKLMEALFSV
jgi:hypothetical protein